MNRFLVLFGVILTMALAAPAFAAPPLPIGGRTLAGPASTSLVASATETIAAGLSGNAICASVANTGSAAVQLTITGGATSVLTIPIRKTLTLCNDDPATASLLCMAIGTGTCKATWRIDDL